MGHRHVKTVLKFSWFPYQFAYHLPDVIKMVEILFVKRRATLKALKRRVYLKRFAIFEMKKINVLVCGRIIKAAIIILLLLVHVYNVLLPRYRLQAVGVVVVTLTRCHLPFTHTVTGVVWHTVRPCPIILYYYTVYCRS